MTEAAGEVSLGGECGSCGSEEQLNDSLNSLHALDKYLTEKNESLYEQIADVQKEDEILELNMEFRSVSLKETYEASGNIEIFTPQTAMMGPARANTLQVGGGFNGNREREVLRLKAIIGWQKETIRHLHEQTAALNAINKNSTQK